MPCWTRSLAGPARGRRGRAGRRSTASAGSTWTRLADGGDRDDGGGVGDVGQQRGRHGAAGRRRSPGWPRDHGAWSHSDAVQAVGHLPVDFAASGLDLMTCHRAQARRPVRGRGAARPPRASSSTPCSTAAVRSATSGPARSTSPPWPASPPRSTVAVRPAGRPRRPAAGAPRAIWSAGRPGRRARRGAHRAPDPADACPGVLNVGFPGCSADAMLMLLDAAGIDCSTGSACSAGVAQPSHVLIAMGVHRGRGALLVAVLPRPHLDRADIAALVAALPEAVDRARRAARFA